MHTCPRKWCIIKGDSLYIVRLHGMNTVQGLRNRLNVYRRVENIAEKGENACYKHFLFFQQ